jgi:small subunit ribosomal protein S20
MARCGILVFSKLDLTTVANIKSAIKRVQIAERNRLRNKSYKSAIKTLTKTYLSAVEQYTATPTPEVKETVQKSMSAAYSKIDKAVKCGVLHPNTGANRKARIARLFRKQVEPYQAPEA